MRRVEYGAEPKTQGPAASASAPNCVRFTPPQEENHPPTAGKEESLEMGVCPLLSSKIRASPLPSGGRPPLGGRPLPRRRTTPPRPIFSERQIFYG